VSPPGRDPYNFRGVDQHDPLSDGLSFRLGSAFRRVDRLLNRLLAPVGLTHAHTQVLATLLADGELRVTDLAQRTGFEQSTVSRLVKELARRRLVKRRPHPDDGRARLYRPGRRATELRTELRDILRRADRQLRRELPEADLAGFRNTLGLIERLP
jgi:DNA-binding MarR family transcriptional regulator